jgi:hypothetical protein
MILTDRKGEGSLRMTSALKVMLHDAMKGKSPARDVQDMHKEKDTKKETRLTSD